MRRHFSIRAVHVVLWALFFISAGFFAWNLLYGTTTLPIVRGTIAGLDVSLALRIDALSSLLFVMVSLLGGAIGRYAIRYLDGEARQWYFFQYLLFTVCAVSLFVLSDNLLMLFAMWLATSYGLHKLLNYYEDRPQAILAARKKIIISRVGDLALIGAIVLVYRMFGTFEFSEIFAAADQIAGDSENTGMLALIGLLFAAGAMSKSAQFPLHFWLPETMETPTPVSALMHAGIINAGGFLMIRLSPLMEHAYAAQLLLALVGATTAVFGALVMITQNDIKKKLAYSTISQMGMMMFACGLTAYTVALFHIFAHSFYKAHAFLATGGLVAESKKTGFKLTPAPYFVLGLIALGGLALVIFGLHYQQGAHFAIFTYGAVLLLGLFQNANRSAGGRYPVIRVSTAVLAGLGIAIAVYALLEYSIGLYLNELVPITQTSGHWNSPQGWVSIASYLIFAVGLVLSSVLMRSSANGWARRLYVYFWNGGYFSQRSTRILENVAAVR